MALDFLRVLTALLFALGAVAAQLDETRAYFDELTERDAAVFGGAVVTWRGGDGGGIDASMTCALGSHAIVGTVIPMSLSSSFRTNIFSEIFLDMTVAYLESTNALPFSRTDTIPREFLPPPYNAETPFENPLFPAVVVSLNTLLLHTSSITEAGFSSGSVQTPGPAASLERFVEDVFATGAHSGIWSSSSRPGLESSYHYSRLNSALVTYILGKVFAQLPTPISVATFIHNTFIAPIGLSGTFLVDTSGAAPAPAFPAGSTATMSGSAVQDIATDRLELAASITIHPAYASDYMYYTSALDIAKLAFELFLGGRYTSIGDALYKNSAIVTINGEASDMPGIKSRSLGMYQFDPVLLCKQVSAETACRFNTELVPYGWIVQGLHNQIALLCSTNACVVAVVSHRMASTMPLSHVVGLAMPSLMRVLDGTPPLPPNEGGRFYSLYVFLGVFGTIVAVVIGSLVADYLIRPVPATAAIPAPKPVLPMGDTMGCSMPSAHHDPRCISPPVRRLDMYN